MTTEPTSELDIAFAMGELPQPAEACTELGEVGAWGTDEYGPMELLSAHDKRVIAGVLLAALACVVALCWWLGAGA
jgi:hypothetical protein